MKENKTLRNIAVALGLFVLWGNIVSLLLPVEEYAAVIKTIDFSTALFVLALLIAVFFEGRGKREKDDDGRSKS